MNYNAARHTIETATGHTLATLSVLVSTEDGFRIADSWGEGSLRQDLDDAEDEIFELEEKLKDAVLDQSVTQAGNEKLREEIDRLEKELDALKVEHSVGADEEG